LKRVSRLIVLSSFKLFFGFARYLYCGIVKGWSFYISTSLCMMYIYAYTDYRMQIVKFMDFTAVNSKYSWCPKVLYMLNN